MVQLKMKRLSQTNLSPVIMLVLARLKMGARAEATRTQRKTIFARQVVVVLIFALMLSWAVIVIANRNNNAFARASNVIALTAADVNINLILWRQV